jgi:drug/metabolite transporter (DMT)-like permease
MKHRLWDSLPGVAAMAATIALWSAFALSTRGIGQSSLTTLDVAIIRFLVPLVVLAPWVPRTLRALWRCRPVAIVAVAVGGLPHFLLFALGADLTTAGLTGLLVPGSAPLFVAAIVFLLRRKRIPKLRIIALTTIGAGVAVTALQASSSATRAGIAVLLLAGLAWAVYTVGLQYAKLALPEVILSVCATSLAGVVALAATGLMASHLLTGTATVSDVLVFTAVQGVGTGLLSAVCYAHAVRALGGGIAAATGAVSPVVTTSVAVPLFAEPITAGLAAALLLIVAGVAGFNLVPSRSPRSGFASGAATLDTDSSSIVARVSDTDVSEDSSPRHPVRCQ